MRIIAGTHKGRVLKPLKGNNIRPTSDRVREAYFNIIGQYFEGTTTLDLYCGSGAIGLEFLSRGAERCIFVDISQNSINLAKENARQMDMLNRSSFYTMSASDFLKNIRDYIFDFIFIDPPYKENISKSILTLIGPDILKENGILTVEHSKRMEYPDTIGRLYLIRNRKFGDTILSFYSLDFVRYKL